MKNIKEYDSNEISQFTPKMVLKLLRLADYKFSSPFQLILSNGDVLACKQILRIVPGKRIVAIAEWKKMTVVTKIFFQKFKSENHFAKELNSIKAFQSVGVPTQKILWHGTDETNAVKVIIFEKINDGITLDEIWKKNPNLAEVEEIMHRVITELATQHVHGLIQKDMNLKNFLITKNQIYSLDGGNLEKYDYILTKKQSLEHLGLFFSYLGLRHQKLQQQLLDSYIKSRSWIVIESDVKALKENIKKSSRKLWERLENKLKRNSNAFALKRTFNTLSMYDRAYFSWEFEDLLMNPEEFFKHKTKEVLQDKNTNTIIKVKIGNRNLVVKRYNNKNIFSWLRHCLGESYAASTWRLGQRLCLFGIPTARPIAFFEKNILGLRTKSYVITEYIKGQHPDAYYANYCPGDSRFIKIAEHIVKLFSNLAYLGLAHTKPNPSSILIENDQPKLISIDQIKEHFSKSKLTQALNNELKDFVQSWETIPEVHALFAKMISKD